MKTETKSEVLNRLFTANGLLKEDWHEHKHYRIITRSGIEKIQFKNNVTVLFQAITMSPNFCVVKACATKKAENGEVITIETFGSAGHNANGEPDKGKQYQYLYYPELAEKRALSRAVLKICNFYELGVFGEDEADDFKEKQSISEEVPMIDVHQKTQLLLLLSNPAITDEEKKKGEANMLTYTYEKAAKVIAAMKALIKERNDIANQAFEEEMKAKQSA